MMNVFLISGFLGSGKTTLIKHFLNSRMEDIGKTALIVNEVGDIGIDGTLLSGRNVDMIEISSGCICCTLKTDFSDAVQEIHDKVKPDLLIVETTGIAQPGDILDTLCEPPLDGYSRLRSLITVIDADLFKAREIFGTFYDNQIRCADILILNKIDLVSSESLRDIRSSLKGINPEANVFQTKYCAIDPLSLFSVDSEDGKKQQGDHSDHIHSEMGGFQSFSFEDEGPLDRKKLDEFLQALPPTLFRLKGWVRFKDSHAHLDFTAGRYRISPIDEPRKTALTFIGRNCDETGILSALKTCKVQSTTPAQAGGV